MPSASKDLGVEIHRRAERQDRSQSVTLVARASAFSQRSRSRGATAQENAEKVQVQELHDTLWSVCWKRVDGWTEDRRRTFTRITQEAARLSVAVGSTTLYSNAPRAPTPISI
jgi:hypothetical protein